MSDKLMFEVNGNVEMFLDDPIVTGPELTPGSGDALRGYIRFRNKDSDLVDQDVPGDTMICWPVWISNLQGSFKHGEKEQYYAKIDEKHKEEGLRQ